ncbi:MAG: DUF3991 domain-containing protein [Eubacterium sp.]|nr:DUF3991 domain-containing protein [Eubacterium sp.]
MQTKKYIPFSEQDRLMASKVDLVSFLQLRGEKLERVGKEYKLIYTDATGKHDSITVRGNHWYDHKNQVGGGPIKLLREHYGMSYQEAMLELLGGERAAALEIVSEKSNALSKKEFKLPEANDDMRRVFAYLTKQRIIDSNVISFFAHQHKIYEDKEHHNAVFVGTDENGVPKQASLRSTISYGNAFRITVSGSDTKYSFSHFGGDEKLFVFEAPIDMLSFITLYQRDWQQHSYIAMNGVCESAVLEALKCHSNIDEVVLCTDNDVGGIDAAERLRDILRENGYTNIFRIIPRNKDFNEDLKELHGLTPIPAVAHLRKELFSENVSQLEFVPINLNRVTGNLNTAISRNKYTDIANIALSVSAEILAKVNDKATEDMFENLRKHLQKGYRAYADRGKMSSKADTLKKFDFEAVKGLKNYPATKEQMKSIAKSFFDLADSALKCDTEQKISEQEESPQQAEKIKMSM